MPFFTSREARYNGIPPSLRGVCKRPAVNSPEWSRNEAKLALSKEGQTCISPTRFPHQHIRMYMRASENLHHITHLPLKGESKSISSHQGTPSHAREDNKGQRTGSWTPRATGCGGDGWVQANARGWICGWYALRATTTSEQEGDALCPLRKARTFQRVGTSVALSPVKIL